MVKCFQFSIFFYIKKNIFHLSVLHKSFIWMTYFSRNVVNSGWDLNSWTKKSCFFINRLICAVQFFEKRITEWKITINKIQLYLKDLFCCTIFFSFFKYFYAGCKHSLLHFLVITEQEKSCFIKSITSLEKWKPSLMLSTELLTNIILYEYN